MGTKTNYHLISTFWSNLYVNKEKCQSNIWKSVDKLDEWKSSFNPFKSMFAFETSYKLQKALRFSDAFKGFQGGALAQYDKKSSSATIQ